MIENLKNPNDFCSILWTEIRKNKSVCLFNDVKPYQSTIFAVVYKRVPLHTSLKFHFVMYYLVNKDVLFA